MTPTVPDGPDTELIRAAEELLAAERGTRADVVELADHVRLARAVQAMHELCGRRARLRRTDGQPPAAEPVRAVKRAYRDALWDLAQLWRSQSFWGGKYVTGEQVADHCVTTLMETLERVGKETPAAPAVDTLAADLAHARRQLDQRHDADRIVTTLCDEYGIDRDHLTDLVDHERSAAGVLDEILADRGVDTAIAGDELVAALRAKGVGAESSPRLERAVQRWESLRPRQRELPEQGGDNRA